MDWVKDNWVKDNSFVNQIADKLKSKKNIYGSAYKYSFLPDKKRVILLTGSYKYPNFYLYDIESDKICWAKQLQTNKSRSIGEILHFDNKMIMAIYAPSAERGISRLLNLSMLEGEVINSVEINGKFTNVIRCKDNIVAGCRDGYLYLFDKNLALKSKYCLKNPSETYASAYSIPSPFNVTTNRTEDYVAFSNYTNLYLFDYKLNFIWEKDVYFPYRTSIYASRKGESFVGEIGNFIGSDIASKRQKHLWAYEILEVNYDSTKDQIKRAFRKKALEWHPDRHKPDNKKNAEEKFKKIVNAYELIGNADSIEVDAELENMGIHVEIQISVVDIIKSIEFLLVDGNDSKYLKVYTGSGRTIIVGINGEYIEEEKKARLMQPG